MAISGEDGLRGSDEENLYFESHSCGMGASYQARHAGLSWTQLPDEVKGHLVWCWQCGLAFEKFGKTGIGAGNGS